MSLYFKRLLEEAVHAFLAGGGAAVLASGDGLSKAAAVGGVVAGLRAVLGIVVAKFGAKDSPSVNG